MSQGFVPHRSTIIGSSSLTSVSINYLSWEKPINNGGAKMLFLSPYNIALNSKGSSPEISILTYSTSESTSGYVLKEGLFLSMNTFSIAAPAANIPKAALYLFVKSIVTFIRFYLLGQLYLSQPTIALEPIFEPKHNLPIVPEKECAKRG